MKTNTNTSAPAQGATAEPKTEIDLKTVNDWLVKDLSFAISLLNAIHTDPDLLNSIATFMLGRIQNRDNKEQQKSTPQ